MTHYYKVIPLKIVHGTEAMLTYSFDKVLSPGIVVTVSVGKKLNIPAIVIEKTPAPDFATKPIEQIVEDSPIPTSLLHLASWMAAFYATHPVTVWQTILPRGVHKKRRAKPQIASHPERNRTQIVLNDHQTEALRRLEAEPVGTSLLHGITGSGKTQIYIERAKQMIANGRSVIILVPEIALTSQLIAEFTPHFPRIIITHSTMTESQRHTVWQNMLQTDEPYVVIGPRSALFSPVKNLGLIVIDECHEPSFKQEKSPRYSALRTAAKRAEFDDAQLILGSATPSVSDYYLAEKAGRPIIRLDKAARLGTVRPEVHVIDMTKKAHFSRHRFFSTTLITTIEKALKDGHQSLLFHNRRGTAPTTMCESCGWSAFCPRCYVPLTLHADAFELRCHICNHNERVPTSCPDCHNTDIIHKGIGTKLLEEEARKLFPGASILRFDGDNALNETLEKQYQALYDGDVDIIIGTQVVAKGLDLPHLRVVGVVQADAGLSLPDYQSPERTFQLLAQVSGRVGRNEHPSTVVVQSYQPQHPAVASGIKRDYQTFYDLAITERARANFPPFCHLLKLVCSYSSERSAVAASQKLARQLRQIAPSRVEILGPTPAFYERVRDSYRWQIILKSPVRSDLVKLIDSLPPAHWQYELDPASLL